MWIRHFNNLHLGICAQRNYDADLEKPNLNVHGQNWACIGHYHAASRFRLVGYPLFSGAMLSTSCFRFRILFFTKPILFVDRHHPSPLSQIKTNKACQSIKFIVYWIESSPIYILLYLYHFSSTTADISSVIRVNWSVFFDVFHPV